LNVAGNRHTLYNGDFASGSEVGLAPETLLNQSTTFFCSIPLL